MHAQPLRATLCEGQNDDSPVPYSPPTIEPQHPTPLWQIKSSLPDKTLIGVGISSTIPLLFIRLAFSGGIAETSMIPLTTSNNLRYAAVPIQRADRWCIPLGFAFFEKLRPNSYPGAHGLT